MQKETDNDTKAKILEVATNLFAQKGFSGTSVRDIAQTAGVNLAAINYHFSNKRNLLQSVIDHGYLVLKGGVEKLANANQSLTFIEASTGLFDLMSQHGNLTLNMMKIMLSEESKDLEDCHDPEDALIGPPGGKLMLEILTQEVGENVPHEKRLWAVRTVFSMIFHKVTIMNSYLCNNPAKKEIFTPEIMREGVGELARVITKSFKDEY